MTEAQLKAEINSVLIPLLTDCERVRKTQTPNENVYFGALDNCPFALPTFRFA